MELNLAQVEDPSMQQMHEEEVVLFIQLFDLLEADDINIDSIDQSLAALEAHTLEHFSHEEALMQAVNFPPYPAHAAEHQMALAKLKAMCATWQQDHDAEALKQKFEQDYLVWLKRHVSTMDDLTAQFYQRKKA